MGNTVEDTDHTQMLTKTFKTDILVSRTTHELVHEYFDFAKPNYETPGDEESIVYPVIGLKEIYEELVADQGPVLVTERPMTQEAIDAQLAAL